VTRVRRAALTYVTSVLTTAVSMIARLVAVPFILLWLGEERYGAFRAVVDWYAYLALLELGLAGALLPLLARAFGRRADQGLSSTLAAGIRAYARQTMLMVAAGLLLMLAVRHLVPVSEGNAADLTRAAFVLVLGLLVTPLLPFRLVAEARQEGYRVNLLLLLQTLLMVALALLLAYSGWGITGQTVALVAGGAFLFGALAVRELARDRGILTASLRRVKDTPAWRELWQLNWPTLIRQLCGSAALLSDRIIVAAFLGPAMVVPLFVTQRLADLARGQLQSFSVASWAGLAELHAQREAATFNRRIVELTSIVFAVGLAVLVPIVAYNHHFVPLWVGGERYAGELVTLVAGANALLLSAITLWDWAFGGTGQVARLVPVSIVSTVINLGLSLTLTPRLGVVGPLLGTLCATTVTSLWYVPVLLRRTFGISLRALLRAVALPVLWGIPFALAVWWLAHRTPSIGWAQLAAEMCAAAAVFLGLWWLVMLTPEERRVNRARLQSVLQRPNPEAHSE
jgi:O-antigen/teichoic acid export membrane protein